MREIKIKTESGDITTVTGFISTGEFDKNRREIFEGDSVKLYYKGAFYICTIVFVEGIFCLKWPDGYINKYPLNSSQLEVVNG